MAQIITWCHGMLNGMNTLTGSDSMKKTILLILVLAGIVFGQTKYFLPVPVESSNGRPIPNQTVVIYPTGTTTNGDTLTWLDAGRYSCQSSTF